MDILPSYERGERGIPIGALSLEWIAFGDGVIVWLNHHSNGCKRLSIPMSTAKQRWPLTPKTDTKDTYWSKTNPCLHILYTQKHFMPLNGINMDNLILQLNSTMFTPVFLLHRMLTVHALHNKIAVSPQSKMGSCPCHKSLWYMVSTYPILSFTSGLEGEDTRKGSHYEDWNKVNEEPQVKSPQLVCLMGPNCLGPYSFKPS